jgi:hypothetical protein
MRPDGSRRLDLSALRPLSPSHVAVLADTMAFVVDQP